MADNTWKKQLSKAVAYGRKNGLAGACRRAVRKLWLAIPMSYETWLRFHSAGKRELRRQQNGPHGEEPLVLVCILPVETAAQPGIIPGKIPEDGGAGENHRAGQKNAEMDVETTESSLAAQTYGKQAICPNLGAFDRNRTLREDRYFLLMEQGVILRPEAVHTLIREAQTHPEADLFYCDHDRIGADGKLSDPFCKPRFDPVFLESFNYVGPLCLLTDRGLQRLQEKQSAEETAGNDLTVEKIGVYGAVKLLAETTVYRVPKILYHVPERLDPRTRLLREDPSRIPNETTALRMGAENPETCVSPTEAPLLSVIIPNRDHAVDLRDCVNSLLERGGYENMEVLIVENHSEERETIALYRELEQKGNIRVLTWEKPFQFARMNNFAASQATGAYLLFLNNDTRLKKEGSIAELMRMGACDRIGAVGARLLYADETIQHAGVVLGYSGIAGHAFEGMPNELYEKIIYARAPRQMAAVTAACMLVKKEAFLAVGGFTEALAVSYNDIDFCMKLRTAGWMVVYDPLAQLYHLESQTRGLELTREKAQRVRQEAERFCSTWRRELEAGDPFYNPNLTLEKPDFSLKR